MRTVYAIQMEIEPSARMSTEDTYNDLTSEICQWIENKYERTWATRISVPLDSQIQTPLAGHTICTLPQAVNASKLFALDWTHPFDKDPSASWITQCVLALHNNSLQISVILRISADRIIMRPVKFELGRPRLVTNILNRFDSTIDGWRIPTSIERLSSPNIQSYVDEILLNPMRNLPVIMVSPDSWNGKYAVSEDVIFERIRGFAHVTVLTDKWAAFKLTDSIDKSLSCYDGAIRIYWPGFRLDDNPYQHKLFFSRTIQHYIDEGLPIQNYLFKTLSVVASFRYTEGTIIRAARQAILDLEKRKVDELREEIRSGGIEKDKLETQFLEALEKIDALNEQVSSLNEDLASQKNAWAEVKQAMADEETEMEVQPEQKKQFEKVVDAFEQARKDFSGPLTFLDGAKESAQKSVYKNPDRVYEALEALHSVAVEWKRKKGPIGKGFKQILQDKYGFDVHQVSQTSGSKWKQDYTFVYKGRSLLFSDHITIGAKQADKCCSIHWYRDEDDMVLVVGYCGEHLRNTKT